METNPDNKLAIYQSADGALQLDVKLENETVWLNQQQMAYLFDKDRTVIGRHIRNAIREGEIDPEVVSAKFAHTTPHGAIKGKTQLQETTFYNLDVIISVGYRVKSQRGVEFRRWATKVLKDYIIKGVARNGRRLEQLGQMVQLLKKAEKHLEASEVLSVIERYSHALDLLDDYDHQTMPRPKGRAADGQKRIADHTLVALTIMIAESRPAEKEMMAPIIMNAIA